MQKVSKNMKIRQEFYTCLTGFIFAGLTAIFALAFLAGWRISIGEWTLPHQFVPFATIVTFVLAFGAIRMMR